MNTRASPLSEQQRSASIARLRASFARRHPTPDGREASQIARAIETHLGALGDVDPAHVTARTADALAWLHRCLYGRCLYGESAGRGPFCNAYHPEDTAAFLRSMQRLPGRTRRALLRQFDDLSLDKVRSLRRLRRGERKAEDEARDRRAMARKSRRLAASVGSELGALLADWSTCWASAAGASSWGPTPLIRGQRPRGE